MGLFDFAANIGKKLFGKGSDDAGQKIVDYIMEDNPGISDLIATVSDDTVTLSGEANSVAAREKAILLAGNVEGIANVVADDLNVRADAPDQGIKVEYYEIQKGDSLWKIASKHLGDGNRYPEIFEANREVIKDPDLIYPGQKIRIPMDS